MGNPIMHSKSSIKRWGGKLEDYLPLHKKMDCSKKYMNTNVHRVLTHTMFWIEEVMIPLYGDYITNSDNKIISVKDICEYHILEDFKFKFIPTVQDYLENIEYKSWYDNGIG